MKLTTALRNTIDTATGLPITPNGGDITPRSEAANKGAFLAAA
jgi:hypothetical protein